MTNNDKLADNSRQQYLVVLRSAPWLCHTRHWGRPSNAGQAVASQISGCLALAITHPPISLGNDLSLGFAPRAFQRRLLLPELLPDRRPSCVFVVFAIVLSLQLSGTVPTQPIHLPVHSQLVDVG